MVCKLHLNKAALEKNLLSLMLTHQEGHTLTCERRLSDFFFDLFLYNSHNQTVEQYTLIRWMF